MSFPTQSTQSTQRGPGTGPTNLMIAGVNVHFPCKAYPSQMAMMSKVTLERLCDLLGLPFPFPTFDLGHANRKFYLYLLTSILGDHGIETTEELLAGKSNWIREKSRSTLLCPGVATT